MRGYETSEQLFFPVPGVSTRYHPKEQVMGLELNGHFKAYPFVELARSSGSFKDTLGGHAFTVEFNPEHRSGRVLDEQGKEIPTVIAFWFAWSAFHPDGQVYTAP